MGVLRIRARLFRVWIRAPDLSIYLSRYICMYLHSILWPSFMALRSLIFMVTHVGHGRNLQQP